MKIITATGKEYECEAITGIPEPPRLYLHLIDVDLEEIESTFQDGLPIEGYPAYTKVQAVSPEGESRVKVSLRG